MKDVIELLYEKEVIFPGSIIDKEILEEIFECEAKTDKFIFCKLNLITRLKMECFFTTERDVPEGCIKLIETEEMAEHANKRVVKSLRHLETTAFILKGHDISSLNEEQKKKHKSEQLKASRCAASLHSEIMGVEVL